MAQLCNIIDDSARSSILCDFFSTKLFKRRFYKAKRFCRTSDWKDKRYKHGDKFDRRFVETFEFALAAQYFLRVTMFLSTAILCWACKVQTMLIKNEPVSRATRLSFGSKTIRSWDRERGFREIRSNGGSASTRLCIGPYMVAGRICLYIGSVRKRGRIRNREAAGTHTYPSRIS